MRRDPDADALDFAFMADNVHLLAPSLKTALGDEIAKLRLKGTLAPAGPWNALLSGDRAIGARRPKPGADVAAASTIAGSDVDWGKAEATGKGVLTLDQRTPARRA